MFGNNDELINLLKEIRDNETQRWTIVEQWRKRDVERIGQEWEQIQAQWNQQARWREEDMQRREDEDTTMRRYIAAMEETNTLALIETARKNHKKLPGKAKTEEAVTNEAV